MFRNLLKPDSSLMITMNQITDCIFLSLFFFLGCVPIVTAGASLAALYDAAYHGFRRGDKHSWHRFFSSFRRNLKASLAPNLVFLILFAAGARGMILVWNGAATGELSWMAFSAAAAAAAVALGILSILFPMLSRFENSTGALLKNTLFLGLANLPRTLLLGILNGAALALCLFFVVPLFFLPCLAALLGTLLIEPMFRPYLPEEDVIKNE